MEVSKIRLSEGERELVQNAEVILTKNRVLAKARALLESIQQLQTDWAKKIPDPEGIFHVPAKISRGENYLGLPYLMLDHPRKSTPDHFFFIRTMFWWGKYFSCTLHLAGQDKTKLAPRIMASRSALADFYIGVSDDPWDHRMTEPAYHQINQMPAGDFTECCQRYPHLKIGVKHRLPEWEHLPLTLFEDWKKLLSVCGLIA